MISENDYKNKWIKNTKVCFRCKEDKPQEEFSKRGDGKPVGWCKECMAENERQRRAKIIKEVLEKGSTLPECDKCGIIIGPGYEETKIYTLKGKKVCSECYNDYK